MSRGFYYFTGASSFLAVFAQRVGAQSGQDGALSGDTWLYVAATVFLLVAPVIFFYLHSRDNEGASRNRPSYRDAARKKTRKRKPPDASGFRQEQVAPTLAPLRSASPPDEIQPRQPIRTKFEMLPVSSIMGLTAPREYGLLPVLDCDEVLMAVEKSSEESGNDESTRERAIDVLAANLSRNSVEALEQVEIGRAHV